MMRSVWPAIRIGLLDMRGDLRRFLLLVVCLAVGTALIAGVNSVGTSITRAIETGAAEIMGGDIELSRADRLATPDELAAMQALGQVVSVIDTNLRAETFTDEAFADVSAVGAGYPLLGAIRSPQLSPGEDIGALLAETDGAHGALIDGIMLDQLGIGIGDRFGLGGTEFVVRGTLAQLPDGPVRGFRLGLPTLITAEGFAVVSDRTSPLPGLGTWYRYKILLTDRDIETGLASAVEQFSAQGWTVRSARDGLGQMVRYYDLFMRFLVIVGLGSLLIGGVSVWTGMRAYIAERSGVIAVLRSIGAGRSRVFIHFLAQVSALAVVGVGIGLIAGASVAWFILPSIGAAVGIPLTPAVHVQPLLVAAGTGLVTAFAFAYLPLQQAQGIRPVLLFRSKGLDAPPLDWHALLLSWQALPLVAAIIAFFLLAWLMTGDPTLVAAFGLASALGAALFQLFIRLVQAGLARLPEAGPRILRHALRAISGAGQNAATVAVSAGMALSMLIVVLVMQTNLQQEFLGASAFDAPTLVGSDLFPDEVENLETLAASGNDITRFVSTPMLRARLDAVQNVPVDALITRGPEATFLLAGEVPLTFRTHLPTASRVTAGEWWPADYAGPGLVSLHQSLRNGLGVDLGDTLTFSIFGEPITVTIASFRDYSWQGGIDFLATFSPGVLDNYPTTLFAAVTAAPGAEEAVGRLLATELPDIRFIAVGDTLKQVTDALGQLSFAASLVGGLAVGNGLLVLIGSLATGRRQREADAVITKVLGATRTDLIATAALQYLLLALLAAVPALALGLGLGRVVSGLMLAVDFTVKLDIIVVVLVVAVVITAILGAMTIWRAVSTRPARLLRDL
ncbi:FtsX-like permease family protein [Devosia sp. XJ19-1]|uniref:FtsX-like permease family protein n=1 Tax=Devosia ureilytica TaxID=2952754 RepID=A0A9Q4ARL8_9HYPH|nr:FtsX-like permease family protein [Devosia ureilytica]MCP8884761.1 FtsX-like permease family protein [Devosia ureilytica]MCP8888392.1 FtsX-like permease family protein [Devosia ureilytica]